MQNYVQEYFFTFSDKKKLVKFFRWTSYYQSKNKNIKFKFLLLDDNEFKNDTVSGWRTVETYSSAAELSGNLSFAAFVQDVGQRPADKWYIITRYVLHSFPSSLHRNHCFNRNLKKHFLLCTDLLINITIYKCHD